MINLKFTTLNFQILETKKGGLVIIGLRNLDIGSNIAKKKMRHFVSFVIFFKE